ncbi:MAG TPA: DedA family protein [Gemmatimonadales bacterium]|nr:DedA family protein [Gemmatimonadales bacterium]
MLESSIHWLLDRFRDVGLPGIVVLMAIESSVLPLPSELVMPPAGYLAAKGEMDFATAVAAGVLGSILGSLANYGLARWLGRAFFVRLGKYVLITGKGLERSERYFAAHGEISIFMGRLLPVVRHLISIPAGIARMAVGRFVLFTGLGALLWCAILTWIGWFIGSRETVILAALDQEARRYTGRALLVLLPLLALTAGAYVWWQRRRASHAETAGVSPFGEGQGKGEGGGGGKAGTT